MVLAFFCILYTGYKLYAPSFSSPFVLDDLPNFEGMQSNLFEPKATQYIFSDTAGLRWLSYASFLLHFDDWTQGNPYPFKLGNFIIHCFNFILVYLILNRCLQKHTTHAASASFALAALWFLHPIHTNTVLYAVQRMTLLSGSFTLITILFLIKLPPLKQLSWPSLIFIWAAVVAGILCKENAILTLPLSLIFLKISEPDSPLFKNRIKLFTIFFLPFLALMAYLLISNKLNYDHRNFSLGERLLSEAYILIEYIHKLIIPNTFSYSIYYDDFEKIESIKDYRFIVALFFWLGLALCIKKINHPLITYGVAIFLTGHILESSFIPLELYFDHRNYIPSIGIAITLIGLSISLSKSINRKIISLLIVLTLIIATNILSITYYETSYWENEKSFAEKQVEKRPSSIRAWQALTEYYFNKGKLLEAYQMLEHIEDNFGYHIGNDIHKQIALCVGFPNYKYNHDDLLKKFYNSPIDNSTDSGMRTLLTLIKKGSCSAISFNQYRELLTTLLSSPHQKRSKVRQNYALLLVQSHLFQNEIQKAYATAQNHYEKSFSPDYNLMIIDLAIANNEPEQALTIFNKRILTLSPYKKLKYQLQIDRFSNILIDTE